MCCEYNCETTEKDISFTTMSYLNISDIFIPDEAKINAEIIESKSEKRLHKNAYIICKVLSYTHDDETVDLENKNINVIIRGYSKLDKKDATLTGVEFASTTAASFVLPGVDILYYFTKGAIQNKKADTRFKSGVHNAYDNSILWVFLKGQPLDLKPDDEIIVIFFNRDDVE